MNCYCPCEQHLWGQALDSGFRILNTGEGKLLIGFSKQSGDWTPHGRSFHTIKSLGRQSLTAGKQLPKKETARLHQVLASKAISLISTFLKPKVECTQSVE